MNILWIVLGAAVLWVIYAFNRLVVLRNRVNESQSDIEVQTKRRYDLIPNLVETVKGYAAHESGVLQKVTEARTRAMSASGSAKVDAENQLSGALKSLFAVAENYPQLKANENFARLQDELADTENKIQAARRFFNVNVRDYNVKIESFPSNLIASAFGFKKVEFFDAPAGESEPVQVKF